MEVEQTMRNNRLSDSYTTTLAGLKWQKQNGPVLGMKVLMRILYNIQNCYDLRALSCPRGGNGVCGSNLENILVKNFVIPGMNVYRISLKCLGKEARGRSSMYSMSRL